MPLQEFAPLSECQILYLQCESNEMKWTREKKIMSKLENEENAT